MIPVSSSARPSPSATRLCSRKARRTSESEEPSLRSPVSIGPLSSLAGGDEMPVACPYGSGTEVKEITGGLMTGRLVSSRLVSSRTLVLTKAIQAGQKSGGATVNGWPRSRASVMRRLTSISSVRRSTRASTSSFKLGRCISASMTRALETISGNISNCWTICATLNIRETATR